MTKKENQAKTNCVRFALALYLRQEKLRRDILTGKTTGRKLPKEGYLVFRISRIRGGMIHCLYARMNVLTGELRTISYKPNQLKKLNWYQLPLYFEGHVEYGDNVTSPAPLDSNLTAVDLIQRANWLSSAARRIMKSISQRLRLIPFGRSEISSQCTKENP